MERSIVQVFDVLDRVQTESTTLPDGPTTKVVGYEYFPNGARKAVILDGKRTEYEYDGQNRVKAMTTSGTEVASYAYYPDDLLRETLDANGVKATRTYDKADRLLTLVNAKGAAAVSSYAYTYDHNGNRLTQLETNPSVSVTPPSSPVTPAEAGVHQPELTTYTYDNANRLKSVTYPADSTYPNGRKVTYTYDRAGNREHETETTPADVPIVQRAGTFDINNRLTILNTTVAAPVVPPNVTPAEAGAHFNANLLISYDNNGNETSRLSTTYPPPDAEGNTPPAVVAFTQSIYDLKDRLVEQKQGPQILTRMEYDADGRRTKKVGEEGIRQYAYDDTSLLAEYSSSGLEIAKYDYGADRLIRLTRADEGTRYMTFDGLGSVTGLTNPSGDVTATYHLDAWGNYRFTSELETSHNRFGFTGHYWDKEASLYYAKARYYDPFTARFTQADSFLGTIDDPPSLHRYFYAAGNPTFYLDPTGHAGSDAQARHFGTYRGDPLRPMDVSNAAARSLGSIEATAETGAEMGVGLLFGAGQFARAFVRGGDEMSRFLIDTYDSAHEFVSTFGARVDRANEASAQAMARGDHYEAGRVFTRELVAPATLAAVTIVETGRAGVGVLERGNPLKQPGRVRSPADFMAEAERRVQAQKARFGNVEAYASLEAPPGSMTGSALEALAGEANPVRRWSETQTPWKRTAFQRGDIDWDLVRPTGSPLEGKTNFEAARAGWSPVRLKEGGKRGFEDVVMHHLNQDPRGGIAELWRSTHGKVPHGMDPPGNWRRERPDWSEAWRREQAAYWRWRAGAYNPPPTDRFRLPGDK